jgi:hypothetical protein
MLEEPSAHKLPVERSWWRFAKSLPPGPPLLYRLPFPIFGRAGVHDAGKLHVSQGPDLAATFNCDSFGPIST